MQRTKTQEMALCALFAALTAVLSQVAIPIGPVPVNMATIAIFSSGALLGSRLGALSMLVWVALGVVGVPVFSMFRGGLGIIFGPTGGFIMGYIPAAFLIGFFVEKWNKRNKIYMYPAAMLTGALVYFTMGTLWYMAVSNVGMAEALAVCVVPFIPGDIAKITAATLLVHRLRLIMHSVFLLN